MRIFWNGIYLSIQKSCFCFNSHSSVLTVIVHFISQGTNSLMQKQIIKHSRIEIHPELLQGIWGRR